ncbi:MAG: hypothetical protein J6Y85_01140 [Alphaproteobacteria bacterium]|nr:hypothetical protein [Alphaproteobacteria bacterium]
MDILNAHEYAHIREYLNQLEQFIAAGKHAKNGKFYDQNSNAITGLTVNSEGAVEEVMIQAMDQECSISAYTLPGGHPMRPDSQEKVHFVNRTTNRKEERVFTDGIETEFDFKTKNYEHHLERDVRGVMKDDYSYKYDDQEKRQTEIHATRASGLDRRLERSVQYDDKGVVSIEEVYGLAQNSRMSLFLGKNGKCLLMEERRIRGGSSTIEIREVDVDINAYAQVNIRDLKGFYYSGKTLLDLMTGENKGRVLFSIATGRSPSPVQMQNIAMGMAKQQDRD